MKLYAGLFLVAIGIGYLTVYYFQSRSAVRDGKGVRTVSKPTSNQSQKNNHRRSSGSRPSGSRSNQVGKTLRRSALVAGTIQKPWGW